MRRLIRLILFVFLAFLLYVGHPSLLEGMGRYLIYETELQPADALVVLSGGMATPVRVLQAVELYKKRYARKIILTREAEPEGYRFLTTLGIHLPTSLEISLGILSRLGVPRRDVVITEGEADSTLEELCTVKALLEKKGWRSLILVTHKWHSRRAAGIMALLAGEGIRILSKPTRYDGFRVEGWWKRRQHLKEVVFEYEKLLDYWRIALTAKLLSTVDRLPFTRIAVRNYLCPTEGGKGEEVHADTPGPAA